jgi:signal transduction histidine kinase
MHQVEPLSALRPRWRDDAAFVSAAGLGLSLCVLSVVTVVSSAQPGDESVISLAVTLVVGVPIAVGLWAWRKHEDARFGRLLFGAGCLFFVATLAESSSEIVYSIGRVGIWLTALAVPALLLAFPSGVLRTTAERTIVGALAGVLSLLLVPTMFMVEAYPTPVPFASCSSDCPANAFMVLDRQPDFVKAFIYPASGTATVLLLLVVAGILARRVRQATSVMRRTLAPMLVVAIVCGLLVAAYLLVRRFSPNAAALDPIGWASALCIPGIAVAFLIGLLRRRFFEAQALERLAFRLRNHPEAEELRRVLAEVLGDPSLEIVYRAPGPDSWVDAAGLRVDPPRETGRRWVTRVHSEDQPVAALVYDSAFSEQRDLMATAGSFALASLENTRLATQVEASLNELQESRARIQAAADSERLRIERDLHDGAQQRLVALRIRLELAAELAEGEPGRGSALLFELGRELEEALEEVRSLARGVYPSVLADQGLEEALAAVARKAPIATTVDARDLSRYPTEVESAVYFCCLEALQNVAKHAKGASSIWISLVDDGALRFAVVDDGAGFSGETVTAGTGVISMRDRLAAVGGELKIHSTPGEGTQVVGAVRVGEEISNEVVKRLRSLKTLANGGRQGAGASGDEHSQSKPAVATTNQRPV